MKKIVLIIVLLPMVLFAINNPYKNLDVNEKFNVMMNYFLGEALKATKPEIPLKKALKDDGATLDPVKYETYFSYIQRLKAIKESRKEELDHINEEYAGKIGFYNGKLHTLKEFYSKEENLEPLLKISINQALKVVYGKPVFSDIVYNEEINLLKAKLSTADIYTINSFKSKEVELFVYQDMRKNFMENSKKAEINVRFTLKNGYLSYKDILFTFEDNEYIAKFINPINEKIKLNIKINDDIFRPLDTGEKR